MQPPRLDPARYAPRPSGPVPPEVADSPMFPFAGATLTTKELAEPTLPEPARHGSGGECRSCARPDAADVWSDARWRLFAPEPLPVPAYLLEPRLHVDLAGLPDPLAGELGRLTVRIVAALEAVEGVGRAHLARWGDGAKHLHVWFFARPAGVLELRGSYLAPWLDLLAPLGRDTLDPLAVYLAERLSQPT